MTNVRDIMTPGAECASVNDTLVEAARKMRDLDVGALPICGDDSKLAGMITDRDIVIRGLAADRDPSTAKVADLADGTPVTVGADDSVEEALATMSQRCTSAPGHRRTRPGRHRHPGGCRPKPPGRQDR